MLRKDGPRQFLAAASSITGLRRGHDPNVCQSLLFPFPWQVMHCGIACVSQRKAREGACENRST